MAEIRPTNVAAVIHQTVEHASNGLERKTKSKEQETSGHQKTTDGRGTVPERYSTTPGSWKFRQQRESPVKK